MELETYLRQEFEGMVQTCRKCEGMMLTVRLTPPFVKQLIDDRGWSATMATVCSHSLLFRMALTFRR